MLDLPIFFSWMMLGYFTIAFIIACIVLVSKADKSKKEFRDVAQKIAYPILLATAVPRGDTSFGSPPQGPEVALDLDPNRFAADASTDADG